ncbi:MAG: SCO family protein [Deltaproteobacteria bacterium]|nr:SCO family protein [Deltaproteobacteria bacterium]
MKRVLGICLMLLGLIACENRELPVLGSIPQFTLTNQEAKPFTDGDMKGKIWVADFIFTSCGGACPLMTERMRKNVQSSIEEMAFGKEDFPVRMVSFSVDPERDTPERLAEYSKDHGANLKYWVFLTGPLQDVTKTVVQGFKISMGKVPAATPAPGTEKTPSEDEIWEVVHGEQFMLIDGQGRIRGYYSSEGTGLRKLLADLRGLLKGGKS